MLLLVTLVFKVELRLTVFEIVAGVRIELRLSEREDESASLMPVKLEVSRFSSIARKRKELVESG